MNLIEAIKSGKRFTRKGWVGYCDPKTTADEAEFFSINDVLANDWEVVTDPIQVTEYQFYNAYARALNKAMTSAPSKEAVADIDRIWKEVAEELWFQLKNKI